MEVWSWRFGRAGLVLEVWSWRFGLGGLVLGVWSWSFGLGGLVLGVWSWRFGLGLSRMDRRWSQNISLSLCISLSFPSVHSFELAASYTVSKRFVDEYSNITVQALDVHASSARFQYDVSSGGQRELHRRWMSMPVRPVFHTRCHLVVQYNRTGVGFPCPVRQSDW